MRDIAENTPPELPEDARPFSDASAAGQAGAYTHDLPALPEVALRFHQRLTHVPLGAWAEVASRDANGEHVPMRDPDACARRRLRRVMDAYPATVVRVRRRIDDTIAAADGFVSRPMIPRMQRVALTAALALVARSQLAAEDFQRLYRPFVDLIPDREFPA